MDEEKMEQRLAGLEHSSKIQLTLIVLSLTASLIALGLVFVLVVLRFLS